MIKYTLQGLSCRVLLYGINYSVKSKSGVYPV